MRKIFSLAVSTHFIVVMNYGTAKYYGVDRKNSSQIVTTSSGR